MEKFKSVLEGGENQPKCKEWKEFVESNKGQLTKKKLRKYENKYKMFHSPSYSAKIEGKQIMDSIARLTTMLDSEGFKPKLVVAADYLTTLFQLLHLREKYESG